MSSGQPTSRSVSFGEYLLPLGVVGVVASMLLPPLPAVLDLLLVANLICAVGLLLTSLYISEPLKLSSLPTVILLTTLVRLALNVSTTRMILGGGEVGSVIQAFGSVVVQGNLIVGLVVFLVITLVQFIVIAKGAERVAEVSARFTLDALPGKQMSIDADVRAGLLAFDAARTKRQELQTESRFYGALDGSMKFVKGDAIAGIVITAINIVGGFLLGMAVEGLSVQQAASHYTLLTVGDGLLAQIPALLNALSSGMIITRVTRGDGASLAQEIPAQLGQLTVVKQLMAAVAGLLALVPGMPMFPFLFLAFVLLLWSVMSPVAVDPAALPEQVFRPKPPPLLQIEVDAAVVARLQPVESFAARIEEWRASIFEQSGLIVSPPEFSRISGEQGIFKIYMRGTLVSAHKLQDDEAAPLLLHTVKEVLQARADEIIDDVFTRKALDNLEVYAPELVASVLSETFSVTRLSVLLRALVRDGISIKSMDLIVQSVAELAPRAIDERVLLQEVRVALRRVICAHHQNAEGRIEGFTLDPQTDFSLGRMRTDAGEPLASGSYDPQHLQTVAAVFRQRREQQTGRPGEVLLVSKESRALVQDLLRAHGVAVPVLAHEEVLDIVPFTHLGTIEVEEFTVKESSDAPNEVCVQ